MLKSYKLCVGSLIIVRALLVFNALKNPPTKRKKVEEQTETIFCKKKQKCVTCRFFHF